MITAPRNGLFSRVAIAIQAGNVRCVADVVSLFGVARSQAKTAWDGARRFHLGFRRTSLPMAPVEAPAPDGAGRSTAPDVVTFERGHGQRRDDCARYEDCLSAAVRQPRLASSPVRCPRACSAFEPRDRGAQLLHLAASRPGEGAVP